MSNNTDAGYILKLIKISRSLTAEKKAWWKNQLPEMNEFQKAQFVHILEAEADAINKNLEAKIEIKKRYAHKKVKALYDYAEAKIEQDEEIELALLDKELENA